MKSIVCIEVHAAHRLRTPLGPLEYASIDETYCAHGAAALSGLSWPCYHQDLPENVCFLLPSTWAQSFNLSNSKSDHVVYRQCSSLKGISYNLLRGLCEHAAQRMWSGSKKNALSYICLDLNTSSQSVDYRLNVNLKKYSGRMIQGPVLKLVLFMIFINDFDKDMFIKLAVAPGWKG